MSGSRQTALPTKEQRPLGPQNVAHYAARKNRSTRSALTIIPASSDRVSTVASAATDTHSHSRSHNVDDSVSERHLHQRSQPQAHTRHSPSQSTAPHAAGSPSASPPRRRYQRHRPYTQSSGAASCSPSPPLLAESISTPSAAAASVTAASETPHNLNARVGRSNDITHLHHIHAHTQPQQSMAAANSPYSLVAHSSMPGTAPYLHNTHRLAAAHSDSRPAGVYNQQYHQQSASFRNPQMQQYHQNSNNNNNNNNYHHHSYSMPASVPMPVPNVTATGHPYTSNTAGFVHGDAAAASSMYLHPGGTSLSASTSPVAPPGTRPMHGSSKPLTAEEKEIKRKVSHSAIEKRRRERTNAVLRELQQIVPGLSKPGKIQKLEILEAAADYIRQLAADPNVRSDRNSKSARNYQYQYQHDQQYQFQNQCRDQARRQNAEQLLQWPDRPQELEQTSVSMQRHMRIGPSEHEQMASSSLVSNMSSAEHAATALGRSPIAPQHTAIATPMSECSNASATDSADETPLISDPTRIIEAASPAAEDPSSMKN
ncbi:hypothetical protein FB639_000588 [Coemansia asiatica]|nr:hypothetical protein FB639_000588 [Coemansia asiatica]